ncbi:MAG: hypothetical protein ACRC1D_04375, partial [Culicoidibacterales bacterium]
LTHDLIEHIKKLLNDYRLNGYQHEVTATGVALETRVNWGIGDVTEYGLVNDICSMIESFAYDDNPLESGLSTFSYVDLPECDDDQIVKIVQNAIDKYDEVFDGSDDALEIQDRITRLMYLGSQTILDISENVGIETHHIFQVIESELESGINAVLDRVYGDTAMLWDGFTLDIEISDDYNTVTVTPDRHTEYTIVNDFEDYEY